jgi:hypothetical protein
VRQAYVCGFGGAAREMLFGALHVHGLMEFREGQGPYGMHTFVVGEEATAEQTSLSPSAGSMPLRHRGGKNGNPGSIIRAPTPTGRFASLSGPEGEFMMPLWAEPGLFGGLPDNA